MADTGYEKKARFLGRWKGKEGNVNIDNIVSQILDYSKTHKGSKCTLRVFSKGLGVYRTHIIQGKVMDEFIRFENIHFMTVNKARPDTLIVSAKDADHLKTYMLLAYRCANAIDAGMFIQNFRSYRKVQQPPEANITVVKSKDDINWTLRARQAANANRQLSKLVDMHGETAVVVQHNGGGVGPEFFANPTATKAVQPPQMVVVKQQSPEPPQNAEVSVEELHLVNKTVHSVGIQATKEDEFGDHMSEASESSSLKDELMWLSNELREVKFLVEKSHGVGGTEYYRKVPKQEHGAEMAMEPIDVEILPESDAGSTDQEMGSEGRNKDGSLRHKGNTGEARVMVPDYRSFATQTAPKRVHNPSTSQPDPTNGPVITRASKISYFNWRDKIEDPNFRISGRPRPRSAIISTGSWSLAKEEEEKINPNQDQKANSDAKSRGSRNATLRASHSFSTTVRRPIEKVYGRPGVPVMYRSVMYRPQTVLRRSVVPVNFRHSHKHDLMEANNNDMRSSNKNPGHISEATQQKTPNGSAHVVRASVHT